MPQLNSPDIVIEVTSLHDAYERALVANDVEALSNFFWNSPGVVRYGINEHLYGAEALAAYRRGETPVISDRRLIRRSVLVIGAEAASVMCEFEQKVFGQARHCRQSQVWVRFSDEGWKIVAAHVSNALVGPPQAGSWEQYVDQAAAVVGLPLNAAHRPGVIQNLQVSGAIVAPLMEFTLPATAEAAPVFIP